MKKILFVFGLLFGFLTANAQGCSDAGFCTLENLQVNQSDSILFKNALKFGANIGFADNDVIVAGSYIEYYRMLSKVVDVDVKVNYFSQSTNGISSSALSDIYLVSNFKLNQTMKATAGLKVPLTNGNLKDKGFVLPMDFQPSLGTLDAIVGLSKKVNKYSFVVAYQQPLTQNENQFFASIGSDFVTTNQFKRAADVLLRASRLFELNDKLTLSPSLLSIYHVSTDKYTDTANVEREITGSDGLTINANFYFNYSLNNKSALEFSLGGPLAVRKVRPDGLTRGLVANLEYRISF